jgi:hypothetical protein
MTVQIRVIKSEWHQVEKRYELLITRYELDEIYPESSEEENDQLWQQLIDNDFDFDELRYDAELQEVWLDWEWMDEDDWWTDRKGGYEVTYSVEEYTPPKTDKDIIQDLRNEVNSLREQLGLEPEYDTRDLNLRLDDLKAEFDKLMDEEEDEEEWVEVGSEAWTEEMDKAAKAEDEVKSKT